MPDEIRSRQDDLPEGVTTVEGADAAAEARRVLRGAERGDAVDPLDGLTDRIQTDKNPSLAFDPLVVKAACEVQQESPADFDSLRRSLKGVGVNLAGWDAAVKAYKRKQRSDEKERQRRSRIERAMRQLEQVKNDREQREAERESERLLADPEVQPHWAFKQLDGLRFYMEPGKMTRASTNRQGVEEVSTLATFSCVIRRSIRELDTPGGTPRTTLALSIVTPRSRVPLALDVPANCFDRMEWPPRELGAVVMPDSREAVRATIGMLSNPDEARRYRFTGLVERDAETIYVHAGGAIGAGGALVGVDTQLAAPGDRFRLPAPLEGAALRTAAGAVLELLAVEPAHVVMPCVGLAFRSALGPCQHIVHVDGLKGLGKSLLVSLVQRLFGSSMHAKNLPLSWRDQSTVNGIVGVLSSLGDCVVVADDLQQTETSLRKFDGVAAAVFNRASPVKLRRDGTARDTAPPRCSLLSTGETLPAGFSLASRVLSVTLEHEPTPNLKSLDARASAGELAGFMAAFIRWYLPRANSLRARLGKLDATAVAEWGLGVKNRAAEIIGALAYGLDELLNFLRHSGAIDLHRQAELRARMRAALLRASGEYRENVERENDARRFVELVGDALRSGNVHLAGVDASGKLGVPANPGLWGWQFDGGEWRSGRPCIGYLARGEVGLLPGAALQAAREKAQRSGRPLHLDERGLGRMLAAAGMLVRTGRDAGRATPLVQLRVGAGTRVSVLALDLSSFGVEAAPPESDEAPAPVDGLEETIGEGEPTVEFEL